MSVTVTSEPPPRLVPLTRTRKAVLAAEVLREYVPALRTLRSNDLPAMVRAARTVSRISPPARAGQEYFVAKRLGIATLSTLRLLPSDSRCLVRSLVVLRLLARRSLDGRLVIGVRPGRDFLAHAWVEYEGRPILPPGEFERLMEL